MLEPNSPGLLVLLALGAIGMLVVLVRHRHLAIRIASGALALVLAAGVGIFIVNDYYGYYETWSQLNADFSGDYATFPTTPVSTAQLPQPTEGRIESVQLPGAKSHINRGGLVYLPPQYFEPQYANTRFPVIELLHGTPGAPSDWVVHLEIAQLMSTLIAHRRAGPMIFVMPTMSVGHDYQECVNAPGALDDTYITQDVRADIEAKFRVSPVAAEWGISGYSSGGYCAANLALRHPDQFGASAIMDGYFRPQDGPAAKALHFNPAAEARNDPVRLAAIAGRTGEPLPSFWLSVGGADRGDVVAAAAFADTLHGVEAVTVYNVPGAGHTFYAWEPSIPIMLQWMWTQIAPPDLRVQFPIAGGVTNSIISIPPSLLAAEKAAAKAAAARLRALLALRPGAPRASGTGRPGR